METYKKYLPKGVKLNEGRAWHESEVEGKIEEIENMLADFEVTKDEMEPKNSNMIKGFTALDKIYGSFKRALNMYAKIADKEVGLNIKAKTGKK